MHVPSLQLVARESTGKDGARRIVQEPLTRAHLDLINVGGHDQIFQQRGIDLRLRRQLSRSVMDWLVQPRTATQVAHARGKNKEEQAAWRKLQGPQAQEGVGVGVRLAFEVGACLLAACGKQSVRFCR